jgi:hypothetical protein
MPDRRVREAEYEKWPRWLKELHAWRSGRRGARVTLAERVEPTLSLARIVPRGFEALRASAR